MAEYGNAVSEILKLYSICESNIQEVHEYFVEPKSTDSEGCFALFKYIATFARDYSAIVGFKTGSVDCLAEPRRSSIFIPQQGLLNNQLR